MFDSKKKVFYTTNYQKNSSFMPDSVKRRSPKAGARQINNKALGALPKNPPTKPDSTS